MSDLRRLSLIVAATLTTSAALAQSAGTPANVNDCTLIQDPVGLRNCILRFEGNRTPPPSVSESPPPDLQDAEAPAAAATNRAARRANPRAEGPKPTAHDTLISIEQIQVPSARKRRDP